jgi:hypothetical protein
VLRTSPSEYQGATGFPLARGSSRGVDETGGRGDEAAICTAFRLPPLRTLDRSLASLPCRDFDDACACRVLGFLAPEVACEHALRQRACRPSWPRAPLQSSPFAPAGKPASSRGVGMHQTVTRLAPALRPSADTSAARPLPVASHLRPRSDQPRSPGPPSWFLTTSTVFSARRLTGLLHPAAGPGVRRVSDREIGFPTSRTLPAGATTPRRTPPTHSRDAVTRARAPLTFFLGSRSTTSLRMGPGGNRGRRLRGLDP